MQSPQWISHLIKKQKHLYTQIYTNNKGRPLMKKERWFDFNQIIYMIGLIVIGTLGRFILVSLKIQPFPNFEIIMVVTFIAAIFLRPTIAIFVPLLSMIFSDLLIGNAIYTGDPMNKIVLFTYSGFALIALSSIFNRNRFRKGLSEIRLKNIGIAAGLGVGFVLIYDVWTNLGWWYLIYPHNLSSLAVVFTTGLPFMIYHMLSGLVTFVAVALPLVAYISKKSDTELPLKIKNIHKIPVIAITILLIILSLY